MDHPQSHPPTTHPAPSGSVGTFFSLFAATTRLPDASPAWRSEGMLDFRLAPANGIPAQPRNFNQALDTPLAPLHCQQTNEAASVTLIERCQNTIDGTMFFDDCAVWMVLTRRTSTCMNGWPSSFFHQCSLALDDPETLRPSPSLGSEPITKSSSYFRPRPKEKIPVPSRDQAVMVIHALADTMHRTLINP